MCICSLHTGWRSFTMIQINEFRIAHMLAGWESGTMTLPSECKGGTGRAAIVNAIWPMTAYECSTCLASTDPNSCLECSKNLYNYDERFWPCGYSRNNYWGRTKDEQIKKLRGQTCVVCSCLEDSADDRKK